jgi:hypothetical protein
MRHFDYLVFVTGHWKLPLLHAIIVPRGATRAAPYTTLGSASPTQPPRHRSRSLLLEPRAVVMSVAVGVFPPPSLPPPTPSSLSLSHGVVSAQAADGPRPFFLEAGISSSRSGAPLVFGVGPMQICLGCRFPQCRPCRTPPAIEYGLLQSQHGHQLQVLVPLCWWCCKR